MCYVFCSVLHENSERRQIRTKSKRRGGRVEVRGLIHKIEIVLSDFPPLSVAATANGVDIIQNLLQIENECEPLSLFALIAIS